MAIALAEGGADNIAVCAQMEPNSAVVRDYYANRGAFWPYSCDLSNRDEVHVIDPLRFVQKRSHSSTF